jgi:hypothetical protein
VPPSKQAAYWDKWTHILIARLWQAVALSMDIEPDTMPGLELQPNRIGGAFDDCPADFKRRLDIACNHAEAAALRCADLTPGFGHSKVALTHFADWALPLDGLYADRFPRESKPTSRRPSDDEPAEPAEPKSDAVPRRGRRKGSGGIDDISVLTEMLRLLAAGEAKSVWDAAGQVAGSAPGHALEATRSRLSRKFRDRHGTDQPQGKTWSDIEH